jgi:hypothetical protein
MGWKSLMRRLLGAQLLAVVQVLSITCRKLYKSKKGTPHRIVQFRLNCFP